MSSSSAALGVYVHFPWCRHRCPYCDFAIAVAPLDEIPHQVYGEAIRAELADRVADHAGRELRSIYFGGGTPALWDPREIARTIAAIRQAFPGDPREITVEANPDDCTLATLSALRAAGASRLSIGAQSFDGGELVQLGREHDAAASLRALDAARAADLDNVSLDLIFALPGRTTADFERSLRRAVAAGPEHLSVYQLTVEPRTSFGERARRGELIPETDEVSAEQFDLAHAVLAEAGFEHYEVSSYARPGRRAVHNSLYWTGADYLGLGNGAHSLRRTADGGGERSGNHRSVKKYLAGGDRVAERTVIPADEMASDLVWLGLRTADGVPRHVFSEKAAPELSRLVAAGLLVDDPGRVKPTPAGLRLADALGARLADALYFAGSSR